MDTRGFNEKDITQSLDKITNAIKATGGELPPVTSDDNGKVLKVVNGDWNKGSAPTELPEVSGTDNGKILKVTEGVWAKGDAPSGPEDFVITVSKVSDHLSLDKNNKEIFVAYRANKNIILKIDDIYNFNGYIPLTSYTVGTFDPNENTYLILGFSGPMYGGSDGDYFVAVDITVDDEPDPYNPGTDTYLFTKNIWELLEVYDPSK